MPYVFARKVFSDGISVQHGRPGIDLYLTSIVHLTKAYHSSLCQEVNEILSPLSPKDTRHFDSPTIDQTLTNVVLG